MHHAPQLLSSVWPLSRGAQSSPGTGAATRSSFSLLLHLQLHLVVHRVRTVLLVLCRWRLPSHHLHLHRPWQKQLLLILDRVDAVLSRLALDAIWSDHVVLHGGGWALAGLVIVHAGRASLWLLVVVLVQLVNV